MNSDLCKCEPSERGNSSRGASCDDHTAMPACIQGFLAVINHNQQHHMGRTFVFLGIAVLLVPLSAICLIMHQHLTTASQILMTSALLFEAAALLQSFFPCGCSRRTRELCKLTPPKESQRLSQLEGRKVLLKIAPFYFAFIAIVLLPKTIMVWVMLSLFAGFGFLMLYFGISKKGRRFLSRPTLLRYKDLTAHDFADWSDKELEDLIKFGLTTGALDGANLVSKFVLRKTELMYLSDSERNDRPVQVALEADQAA